MIPLPAFHSPEPEVRLRKAFVTPFRNVIATARTCYSSNGIVEDESFDLEKYLPLAKSIYEAGHHTTFQHAQFQFTLANVSRQFAVILATSAARSSLAFSMPSPSP